MRQLGIPSAALLSAAIVIAIAKLWVRMTPGAAIRWATSREAGGAHAAACTSARAIAAVGARVPLRASCLEQGIALVIWLAASHRPSRLVVGVTRSGDELRAHAWVECGGAVILGGARAGEFAPLPAVTS